MRFYLHHMQQFDGVTRGGILRPGPWHLSMGDYPYEHRHVRLRGGPGAAGAVLRAARWQTVDTPVIVLANMDATYHRNYYHWMALAYAATLATNPAMSLPCGVDEHGMPFGLQLIAPLRNDAQLLQMALAEQNGTQVVQVGFQLFPLSVPPEREP